MDQKLFLMVQQHDLGLGHRIVEVFISHTIRHARPVVLLWTSDQLITEAATYATPYKHKRWTSMPLAGFKLVIPWIRQLQAYALDSMATRISRLEI
jgi:hypothetical protein